MEIKSFTITKRDGSKDKFSLDKIMNAIVKAFESVEVNADLGLISKIISHLDIHEGIKVEDNALINAIYGNYTLGMIVRAGQANMVAMEMRDSNLPCIVTGDFNDVADSPVLTALEAHGYHNISKGVKGRHGVAKASYRYLGHWQGIDHIFVSPTLLPHLEYCHINDAPFLLEPDKKYGGHKPFRTYNGYRFQNGFSDHLPLVVRFQLQRH